MHQIYWKFSKVLLFFTLMISFVFPILFGSWFIFDFDIPFIHSGDKFLAIVFMFLWWISTIIFILGWDVKSDIQT